MANEVCPSCAYGKHGKCRACPTDGYMKSCACCYPDVVGQAEELLA